MTNEEAINLLDNLKGMIDDSQGNDYDSAFNLAIKSLKKQLPKKIIGIERRNMKIRKCTWVNGTSNVKVGCNSKFVKWQGVMNYYRYCPYCGKSVKWE